jgi:CDP-diacylglycerol--serine O-phosphatidyltransferase
LPNVVTAFALSCGLFAIFKMSLVDTADVTAEVLTATAAILLLAAFADLLDGAIARAMKAESAFGGIFDSLSDAITFGVAPSVIVLKSFPIGSMGHYFFFLTVAAMVYSVCGILRLARYNVMSLQSKVDSEFADSFSRNFTGLPIPGAASAIVSLNLLLASKEFQTLFPATLQMRAQIMLGALLLVGYFMISRWKFPSFKRLHVRVASFQTVFLTVIFAVFIFYGLLHHFAIVFFGCSWLYLIVAAVLSLIRLISGRTSKTLEDFEPDADSLDEQQAED